MSSCSCLVSGGVDECVTLLRVTNPIARKSHTCMECNRDIPKGEKYYSENFVYEGDFSWHKTCDDCMSIRELFGGCGFMYTRVIRDLEDMIDNCGGQIFCNDFRELTPAAREKVINMVEAQWVREEEREIA